MDRTRRTDARRAGRRRIAGLTALLAAASACHDLLLDHDRVVALEVATTLPRVAVGDTLRLVAKALNVAGQEVTGAGVTWAVLDTGAIGFTLTPEGLVTGVTPDTARVQATADAIRTSPLTLIVTPAP